jgi:hypothetical protein
VADDEALGLEPELHAAIARLKVAATARLFITAGLIA